MNEYEKARDYAFDLLCEQLVYLEQEMAKARMNGDMKAYLDLCQYFGQKKLKYYADFFSSSSSLCCGVI